jgi:AcrR family transcriptional regulator
MARWKPDARDRLVVAALDLFTEQGYDDTTVAQIAERAGLTRSTFFRHFPDKRDVLAAGQETLSQLLGEGIAGAPEGSSPLVAVVAGLRAAGAAFTPSRKEIAPKLQAAIAASAELQQRSLVKEVGLATAMADALLARGLPDATARVAAELGALAFRTAYPRWAAADDDTEFGDVAEAVLRELHAASTQLA